MDRVNAPSAPRDSKSQELDVLAVLLITVPHVIQLESAPPVPQVLDLSTESVLNV